MAKRKVLALIFFLIVILAGGTWFWKSTKTATSTTTDSALFVAGRELCRVDDMSAKQITCRQILTTEDVVTFKALMQLKEAGTRMETYRSNTYEYLVFIKDETPLMIFAANVDSCAKEPTTTQGERSRNQDKPAK